MLLHPNLTTFLRLPLDRTTKKDEIETSKVSYLRPHDNHISRYLVII